jgi:hypothetical protein
MENKINRILEKIKILNIEVEPTIDIQEINKLENEMRIKFPKSYVLYLTKIQNGGSSDELHKKGPYYGIYSIEKSFEQNMEWEVNINEEYKFTDDFEIPDDEKTIEEYKNTVTLNGSIPICEYGCGVYFRLIVNGKKHGEIWADCGTIEGEGYYSLNVDILTFYENWLDREIIKLKDPSKKLINAWYSFLEFGNNNKYKIVE